MGVQRKMNGGMVAKIAVFTVALPTFAIAGEDILRTKKALEEYQSGYMNAKDHKAIAQSPNGAWAWRADRTFADYAREDALNACNLNLRKGEKACRIVNVDGNWVAEP